MFRALRNWLYDRDALAPLAFEAPLQSLKARLAGGELYFEGLIGRHLIGNTHRTTLVLLPDAGLAEARGC